MDKKFDLNLLAVFDALMREQHVGRAAERLRLTQPAVSHALGRLRDLVGDPLFIRHSRGIRPTPRADELSAMITPALAMLQGSLSPPSDFDPATVARTVVIGSSDYVDLVLLPHLVARLRREAPGVDLRFRPTTSGTFMEHLRRREIDMAIGPLAVAPRSVERLPLFVERAVLVARNGHPALAGRLFPAQFAELPQLLISPQGDPVGRVDQALGDMGLARRVAMTVPHFAPAPFVIEATDLVAVMPERVANRMRRAANIAIHDLPVDVPPWTVGLAMASDGASDPLVDWLVALMREVAELAPSIRD